ncbi:MAG: prenyltransferase [Methanomassiliicoccus sp.]|nr:prenyltransferase [Methanomassiliicoccus sp.]
MRSRALVQFARFKPLAAWSVSASVLGASLAFYLTGGSLVDPASMLLAMVCVILMQYVAHPMNDIMDLELDRKAPIASTGRFKPLVDGSATVKEASGLSAVIVAAFILIMVVLIIGRPVLLLPAIYGTVALFGYNHPRLRWAYRPYTELYLGVPINTLSVLVISYVGSGIVNSLSVTVSIVFGFASSAFFVSMMSMDYPTDRANGKITTVVRWPRSRYCTWFPLFGLAVAIAAVPVWMNMGAPAIAMIASSVAAFAVLALYGKRVDELRMKSIHGSVDHPEASSGNMRLGQLGVSIVFSMVLSLVLLSGGLVH